MLVHLHIHYNPSQGQVLSVFGNTPECGFMNPASAVEMTYLGYGYWELQLMIEPVALFEYRYLVQANGQTVREEWGRPHHLALNSQTSFYQVFDFWQSEPDIPSFYTSAFSDSLLSVDTAENQPIAGSGQVVIRVFAPIVRNGQWLGLSGDCNPFGNWDPNRALRLTPLRYPEWELCIDANKLPPVSQYKFVLTDKESGQVVSWEWGEPRVLNTTYHLAEGIQINAGLTFRYQEAPWKGTGLAIPAFSIRSETSWGCGDFNDLKKMIHWVALTHQQLIQLLPLNDTTLSGTWRDSYPYNAISIHALHPMYLSPIGLPDLKDTHQKTSFELRGNQLNSYAEMDYEGVMRLKWDYIQALYDQEGETILHSAEYLGFFEKNQDWLLPYAAFCYLRIKLDQSDFNQWGTYAVYSEKAIKELCNPDNPWHHQIAIHYVVQFLLQQQLRAARDEAHRNRVVLKGDIPIGVNPKGVDVWVEPHLFNRAVSVGAPPDTFSKTGQNWGFPSYNWDKMASDNYTWWKRRFTGMSAYFDVFRIDHLLGFFRIWEIPAHAVQGLLGQFNPAIPYSVDDLSAAGFDFTELMATPCFSQETLQSVFGETSLLVQKKYLKRVSGKLFTLKAAFNTQQKIKEQVVGDLKETLMDLCNEVLFLEDNQQAKSYHPRINARETYRYKELDAPQQAAFQFLHDDFYYNRQTEFWKQKALEKLGTLVHSTNMLVCGEDLGMIPACVPDVMHQLHILSLEIQRMPKAQGQRFENLNSIPYLSVCSPSTHDINPLRAWWKESMENASQYYQQVLWKPGLTPEDCTPEIVQAILNLHLTSPAMWVVIPWQDWIAIDADFRRQNPDEERINVPSNTKQYWRYRMHLTIETLLEAHTLSEKIASMIRNSGRNA